MRMQEMIANKLKPGTRPHTTHSACELMLSIYGGQTVGCCCTGHDCSLDMYPLDLRVPGMGKISAMKKGELEREYLLIGGATVGWYSHSDIAAQFKAQHA